MLNDLREKTAFEYRKVFDCQDMPEEVKGAFFEDTEKGNDCFVELFIEEKLDEDDLAYISEEYNKVINWLLENGAEEGEHVIIKHWW